MIVSPLGLIERVHVALMLIYVTYVSSRVQLIPIVEIWEAKAGALNSQEALAP